MSAVVDVDAEIRRRARNRRGRYPKEFPDGYRDGLAPQGAVVDGYQLRHFGIWHRIDDPAEIDLELLRGTSPWMRTITTDGAAQLWRDSIGELG